MKRLYIHERLGTWKRITRRPFQEAGLVLEVFLAFNVRIGRAARGSMSHWVGR